MPRTKHYREKIENAKPIQIETIEQALSATYPPGRMVIANPHWVEDYVKTIPEGQVRTVEDLRKSLAQRAEVDYACPMTTGIFLRIVAEAAYHEQQNNMPVTAPWWRVVANDGSMNPKLPGGGETQLKLLLAEGHHLAPGRYKKPRILFPEKATA